MNNFDRELIELKSKLGELSARTQKIEKRCTILYFVIACLGIISLLVIIGFLMYHTGSFDSLVQVTTPIAVVLFMLSFSLKDFFIYKFSNKLRNLNQEIQEIVLKINERIELDFDKVEEDTNRVQTINNLPRAEFIPNLPAEQVKPIENITKIVGILSLMIGGISVIASAIAVDELHPLVFGIMLVMGAWLHIYGYFAIFTKRPIWSMYWPTITIGSLVMPPLLVFLITMNFEEWIYILSTCLGVVLGLTLFTLIMFYKVARPNKIKNKFLLDNREILYIVDTSNLENYSHEFEMRNLKNDYVWSKIFTSTKHVLVLMKYVDGEYSFIEEIRTVEFLTAKYEAARKLVALYQEDDSRPIFEFDESIVDENTLNIQRLGQKLGGLDFLKEKIEVVDDTITISFNKYLTVYLSDDYCSYLNTHFHPTLIEGFAFISELINEDIVFVQSKITKRWKVFPGYFIDELLRKNKKKAVRIFSAVKVYKE